MEPLLKRIASERIFLLTSGGSDWIAGSGKAEKVEGGYRINARKIFTSGAPTGDLLMTGAVLETPEGPMVLHFGVPMSSPHVKVLDTWRTLGMRATGSHDVLIEGHVVPEAAVAVKRKAGEWHPLFHIIATIAFPLVYAVYVGVAESARELAVELAKRKQPTRHTIDLAGRMDTELAGARLGLDSMLAAVRLNAPSAATINQVMIGKALVTAPRHRRRRIRDGGGGRRRLLPLGGAGAEVPRHPGRPLPSAAVRPAGRVRRRHGPRAAGGADFLKGQPLVIGIRLLATTMARQAPISVARGLIPARNRETIMSIISSIAPQRTDVGGIVRAVGGVIARWWTAYTIWRIERLAISRLMAMSDRQLRDIGIERSQIAFAARGGDRER